MMGGRTETEQAGQQTGKCDDRTSKFHTSAASYSILSHAKISPSGGRIYLDLVPKPTLTNRSIQINGPHPTKARIRAAETMATRRDHQYLGLPEAGRGPDRSLPPSLPAASAKATEAEAGAAAGEGEGEGEEDVAVVATQAAGAGSPLLVLEEGSRARNNRKRRGENADRKSVV